MTAPSAGFFPAPHPSPGPPGVVYAAAVLTWVVATSTAALTLLVTVGVLWFMAPFFDAFEPGPDNPRWYVLGAAASVIALSALADVVAFFMLRARPWPRWTLLGLSAVTALGGLVSANAVFPLFHTGAAATVIVLLSLPEARAWFRSSRVPDPAAAY